MGKLGKLKEVNIREVWPHEQFDFSKWLAQEENIQELSNGGDKPSGRVDGRHGCGHRSYQPEAG